MALKEYSVWAATPVHYDAQTPRQDSKSPHIYLYIKDNSERAQAAINVKSTTKDSSLVYWIHRNFSHPITDQLEDLDLGDHKINESSGMALDYLRTQPSLINIEKGEILPYDVAGPNNDILDKLEPVLKDAIHHKATIYLFGQSYHDSDGESGIHDIHMNQGNTGSFEDAVYSDGGFILKFPDGHWEAVFLAFASQEVPTNDQTGKPTANAETLEKLLGGS